MAIDSTLVMNQYLYKTPALRSDQRFRADHAGREDHRPPRGQCASDLKSVEGSDRQGQGRARQAQLRRRHHHDQAARLSVQRRAGIDTVLVPYNGSAEVAHGILTKSVDFVFDGPSAELPLIQSGDLRALAKLDGRPFPALPDLPTLDAATGVASRRSHGLARPRRAARHAAGDRRQARKARSQISSTIPPSRRGPMRSDCIRHRARPRNSPPSSSNEAARWPPVVKKSGMHFD